MSAFCTASSRARNGLFATTAAFAHHIIPLAATYANPIPRNSFFSVLTAEDGLGLVRGGHGIGVPCQRMLQNSQMVV
ncbi:MAG: hypothetical protein ACRD2O_12715 [Terriglobia bacterium]